MSQIFGPKFGPEFKMAKFMLLQWSKIGLFMQVTIFLTVYAHTHMHAHSVIANINESNIHTCRKYKQFHTCMKFAQILGILILFWGIFRPFEGVWGHGVSSRGGTRGWGYVAEGGGM